MADFIKILQVYFPKSFKLETFIATAEKITRTETQQLNGTNFFSAIENFEFQTWRDFSDLRLIEPSTR